ncbi:DNA repair protein RecO [Patescibacteria group bacterium]|nr:DNA repair protein RecO [Patescibacteria group bacterium]
MPGSYKTEAIVLKRINFGEADRLVTVFSQREGKLVLLAKGIRRLTSRKKGHLEQFNQVKLQIAKGKNLDLITEAEAVNNFSTLRRNLNRVKIAYLLLELVDKLTAENQEHREVYQLLLANLSLLDSQAAPADLIEKFEIHLLSILGFGLPARHDRPALEAHILAITEKPLNSKKLK